MFLCTRWQILEELELWKTNENLAVLQAEVCGIWTLRWQLACEKFIGVYSQDYHSCGEEKKQDRAEGEIGDCNGVTRRLHALWVLKLGPTFRIVPGWCVGLGMCHKLMYEGWNFMLLCSLVIGWRLAFDREAGLVQSGSLELRTFYKTSWELKAVIQQHSQQLMEQGIQLWKDIQVAQVEVHYSSPLVLLRSISSLNFLKQFLKKLWWPLFLGSYNRNISATKYSSCSVTFLEAATDINY